MITFEYPLNERIRILLRLEDIFDRFSDLCSCRSNDNNASAHHAALATLFEMLEIVARADLKFDLIQELERQRQILLSYRNNPDIARDILDQTISELEKASAALIAMQGKTGHHLRENEWLMAIKNRMAVPGGVCEFDLPGYHYWRQGSSESRMADLQAWAAPFLPLREAGLIVLRLLRASGHAETRQAIRGTFHQMLSGRVIQLVSLRLPMNAGCVPEISASKYALNIRFLTAETGLKAKLLEDDLQFEMTFCNL